MQTYLKRGDAVYHVGHKSQGTVESTPRAHSDVVRVKLAGNATACYYKMADVRKVGADGEPEAQAPAHDANRPSTDGAEPPPRAPDAEQRPPEESFPLNSGLRKSEDRYDGDLTLERLVDMRQDLARRLEKLDEQIALIRVHTVVRLVLADIRPAKDVGTRVALTVDALKIKQDTEKATAAAMRLAARGAL